MALSPREIDVIRELASGKSNKEISSAISISGETVKFHLKNIQAKLGLSSRVSVAVDAIRSGLIKVPDKLC